MKFYDLTQKEKMTVYGHCVVLERLDNLDEYRGRWGILTIGTVEIPMPIGGA